MRSSRLTLSLCLVAALSACTSGGPPTAGTPSPSPAPSPSPSPTPTPAACSLSNREDWAKSVIDEWYLFPTLVDNSVNKAAYSDLQSYIDALLAPARAQSKDRYFTYVTSASEEDAFGSSGATAGFGVRLGYDTAGNRVFVIESFEGAPALGQNIDRGDELLAVNGQNVSTLMVQGGPSAVINALGPDTVGTSRTLRIRHLSGVQIDVTLAKANYSLRAVSTRYGAKMFNSGGTMVGYINLRSFFAGADTAEQDLRNAFQDFKNQGVTRVIIDLRYNGGGYVSLAEFFGDLLLANKVGQVFSYTTHRASKSSLDDSTTIGSQSQAISPTKIAFIGTGGSASASELLMNAMPPYLANNVALIGSNTYGKPVGQFGFDDTSGCDDRLRVIAFRTENASHSGDYYTGLAATMPATCKANDDIAHQLGDANETMVSAALNWLGGGSCTAIAGGGVKTTQALSETRNLLQPRYPNAAQAWMPGVF